MRFVESAVVRPHQCAVLPQLGSDHRDGYVDSGNDLPAIDPHIYVSVVAVREMCRVLGWPTLVEHRELQEQASELRLRVRDLEIQVREADRFAEAAEYTLNRFGQKVVRKPGRPRKEAVA